MSRRHIGGAECSVRAGECERRPSRIPARSSSPGKHRLEPEAACCRDSRRRSRGRRVVPIWTERSGSIRPSSMGTSEDRAVRKLVAAECRIPVSRWISSWRRRGSVPRRRRAQQRKCHGMIAAQSDDRGLALVELACLLSIAACAAMMSIGIAGASPGVDHLHIVERKYVKRLAVGLRRAGRPPGWLAQTVRRCGTSAEAERAEQRCVCAATSSSRGRRGRPCVAPRIWAHPVHRPVPWALRAPYFLLEIVIAKPATPPCENTHDSTWRAAKSNGADRCSRRLYRPWTVTTLAPLEPWAIRRARRVVGQNIHASSGIRRGCPCLARGTPHVVPPQPYLYGPPAEGPGQ